MGSGPEQLTARTDARNGVARVALRGELDMATTSILNAELTRVEHDGVNAIMLDLRDVGFVDSSGLQAFLQARDRATTNGHRMVLIGASQAARRLFGVTKTEFLLDEQEAVSVLAQFAGKRRDGDSTGFPERDGDG
jgi:anti-anti-sigma factor